LKRIIGITIGFGLAVLAFISLNRAFEGRGMGYTDIFVWWSVIGTFLTLASASAIIGSIIHTRPTS